MQPSGLRFAGKKGDMPRRPEDDYYSFGERERRRIIREQQTVIERLWSDFWLGIIDGIYFLCRHMSAYIAIKIKNAFPIDNKKTVDALEFEKIFDKHAKEVANLELINKNLVGEVSKLAHENSLKEKQINEMKKEIAKRDKESVRNNKEFIINVAFENEAKFKRKIYKIIHPDMWPDQEKYAATRICQELSSQFEKENR
jgi:hypothetical protein